MRLTTLSALATVAAVSFLAPNFANADNFTAPSIVMVSATHEIPKINLNQASASDLEALKGIGSKKAKAIVEYRQKSGHFKSLDDLNKVKGINSKLVAKFKDKVVL